MNQILFNNTPNKNELHNKNPRKIFKFKIVFSVCLVILIALIIYYSFFWFELNKKERISTKLKDSFNITQMYSRHFKLHSFKNSR